MAYTGEVIELPLAIEGLTGLRNLSRIRPTQLLQAENVSYEGGVMRKEGGALPYNATPLTGTPTIVQGVDWWPTPALQRMVICTSAGDILKDSGAGTFPVTLASGLSFTADTPPVFTEGGIEASGRTRKLFLFSAGQQVKVLNADGAAVANVATPAADWAANFPTFGVNHANRMWGGGNANALHTIYFSSLADHEQFVGGTSGFLTIFPGEGDRLIGAVSFKGLLICFKAPRGVYIVDTRDPVTTNWVIDRLNLAIGIQSSNAIVPIDEDILFFDQVGNPQVISSVVEFGNLSSEDTGERSLFRQFALDNLNLTKVTRGRLIYYAAKREVHYAVPKSADSTNTARVVLDLNDAGVTKIRWTTRDISESLWTRRDVTGILRPVSGDNAGVVWLLDQADRSKSGLGYLATFQTPHIDFSHVDPKLGSKRKNGSFIELVVEPQGNWNLDVNVYWDGALKQTIAFNMGVLGGALGSFILGTSALGGNAILNRRKRLLGSGRRLSLVGSNAGLSQDFSISKFYISCKVSGEGQFNA